jgi:hypothetical protein
MCRPETARSLCCGAPGLDQLLTPSHINGAHRGVAGNGRVDQRPDGAQFLHAASSACSSVGDLAPSRRGSWLRFTGDLFTPYVGFFHLSDPDELADEVRAAGLEIVQGSFNELDGRWPYLVVRRHSAQNPVTSRCQAATLARSGESALT